MGYQIYGLVNQQRMTSRKVMRCWFTKVNQIDWRDIMNTRKNIDYSEMYEIRYNKLRKLKRIRYNNCAN